MVNHLVEMITNPVREDADPDVTKARTAIVEQQLRALKQISKMAGYEDNPKITVFANQVPQLGNNAILQK